MLPRAPKAYCTRFVELVNLLDAFCDNNLNFEYKVLCRDLAFVVCQKGSPARSGKPEGWAAGIVCAIGRVNFLNDPSNTPHMKSQNIAKEFGVSDSTMNSKMKTIWNALDLIQFDPDWCIPSMLDINPLVWIVEIDGFLVDIRNSPRELQVKACESGLIPFIYADKKKT